MEERYVPKETAIRNAEFSLKMEGLSVDDKYKKLCEKLLNEEITFTEYLKSVKVIQGLNA